MGLLQHDQARYSNNFYPIGCNFRKGKDLPKAARKMGNRTGMAYNYFRVMIKELRPREHHLAQISSLARKSEQQVRR